MSSTVNDKQSQSSLPTDLHAATREEHLLLNRQILARLPLCLPPHSHSPLLYANGMVVFSQIYLSFEQTWDDLLSNDLLPTRTHRILRALQTPGLRRTEKLQKDLTDLKTSLGPLAARDLETLYKLSTPFAQQIRNSISDKPHILLAYTWTMYLALFNGGRWISKQLHAAGNNFWLGREPALSFWSIPGEHDGEEIKVAFKQNFHRAAAILTEEEKRDVVEESKRLFVLCSEMVLFLDQYTTTSAATPGVNNGVLVKSFGSWIGVGYFAVFSLILSIWQVFVRSCTSWRKPALSPLVAKDVHVE